MIAISRKTDYALIALSCLIGQDHGVLSARQIAQRHHLPLPLVMNILKTLQHNGILSSTRGPRGGYRVIVDLDRVSLLDLIRILDESAGAPLDEPAQARRRLLAPPLEALYHRLLGFLRDVKVLDLIAAGRRIDVPLEMVRIGQQRLAQVG